MKLTDSKCRTQKPEAKAVVILPFALGNGRGMGFLYSRGSRSKRQSAYNWNSQMFHDSLWELNKSCIVVPWLVWAGKTLIEIRC